MGNAAGELADRVILTEDDPGPEAVEAICADIGVFLQRHGKAYTVVPNREQAVEQAILGARRPPWFCWRARAARPSKSAKAAPSPASRTGSWPADAGAVRRAMTALDQAFRAAGAGRLGRRGL